MLIRKKRIPVTHMLFIGMLPSFLKKMVYRLMGYQIGKNVSLSIGSVIIGKKVSIGDNVKVAYLTIIRGKEITLGRFVRVGSLSVIDTGKIFIDEDARINEQVYIGGMKSPQSSFHLGKRAIVMQLSYINPTLPVYIGDDSGIGGHCLLFTHGSWNSQLEGFPVKFASIHLGKKVWLPWRVFVMPGVNVGDNVVIELFCSRLTCKSHPGECADYARGEHAKRNA
jgi:acetyltransferase-like isoleucine patch superfamily enzyme